jgi:hypothetical protein
MPLINQSRLTRGILRSKPFRRISMGAHLRASHPFPHGLTAKGVEIVILTWRDLEFFSQVQVRGEEYRTYCPIHDSHQERSLAIQAATGFGRCFGCEARVFVADFNPLLATRLQRRRGSTVFPHQKKEHPQMSISSHSKKQQLHEKPPEEWQLLSALQAQGALDLDRDTAWNGQAYLEARHLPLEIAHRAGVAYIAPETVDQYGEWLRPWEDHLLFPLITPSGEVGFLGRLITHWQCSRDAAAHQARLCAEKMEPWRKTGRGWFWEPQHLPASEPIVVVDGPFDRLAVLAAGGFEPGEVVALAGKSFQPAWLTSASAALFALGQSSQSKEAGERFKQHLSWKDAQMDVCCLPARGSNWSERWRREGADGLELLYADHARLANGL